MGSGLLAGRFEPAPHVVQRRLELRAAAVPGGAGLGVPGLAGFDLGASGRRSVVGGRQLGRVGRGLLTHRSRLTQGALQLLAAIAQRRAHRGGSHRPLGLQDRQPHRIAGTHHLGGAHAQLPLA
jgi:hypothetical protein